MVEKSKVYDVLKVILTRPLARIFWRRSVKKAIKIVELMDSLCK